MSVLNLRVRVPGLWLVAAGVAFGLAAVGGAAAHAQSAVDKSIFVSAVDASGAPVRGLTAAEFRAREDGTDREVVGLEPATDTLNIVILADTTQNADTFIRDIRDSLTSFVRQVHAVSPEAQISLMEFGQAAVTITPFTNSTAALEEGISKLVSRPDADSVLLEALIAANDSLAKRPSPRRAVVILNMEPSTERSREDPKRVQEALRNSVAQLWAVSLQKGALRNATRDIVLGALTKNTGGRREFLVASAAAQSVLKGYADTLTAQYELTYKRPESAKRPLAVQVGVLRQGLRLHASGFAPK
jgi:VWFA-related protein